MPIVRDGDIHGRHYFLWIETPEGLKWASKNPEKARRIKKLKQKISRRSGKFTNPKTEKSAEGEFTNKTEDDNNGVWIFED